MTIILLFLILFPFANSYSQTYLYDSYNTSPKWEIWPDKIYRYYGSNRNIVFEIEGQKLYEPMRRGYDAAGNPAIIPKELCFSISGSKCYTYFRENGNRPLYYYHVENGKCYNIDRENNNELYCAMKLEDDAIYYCFPGKMNELVSRIKWKSGPRPHSAILFYLSNLK
jgi:hypothetical protein